jgi:hypothetical protein
MNEQELLDWDKLYAWASSKPEGYELGQSCAHGTCPLAIYLYEQTGRMWSVGQSIRHADGSLIAPTRHGLSKPQWVGALIHHVDSTPGERHVNITRERFLEVLEQVKQGNENE